jgi:hypothetical protein
MLLDAADFIADKVVCRLRQAFQFLRSPGCPMDKHPVSIKAQKQNETVSQKEISYLLE